MKQKISILIPYYGKWPVYFGLFLNSCRNNEKVLDILFLTDIEKPKEVPANVKFINLRFEELKTIIRKKLNINIPDIPYYKLCDFRPLYGDIFEEYVKEYDFWGYGDIDLIYGNLNKYLTSEILDNYDVFAFRSDHLHGPFTIYRNSPFINKLYSKCPFLNEILISENYLSFDEFGKSVVHISLINGAELESLPDDNITTIVLKEQANGNIRLYMNHSSKERISGKDVIFINNGCVTDYYSEQNYSFYHWVIEKRALYFKYPVWKIIPERFYVSSSGFYTDGEFRYYFLYNKYRKMKGICQWYLLRLNNFILRKRKRHIKIDTYPEPGFVKRMTSI